MSSLSTLTLSRYVLLVLLTFLVPGSGLAQTTLDGRLSVTYRGGGNAQAAVVSAADRTVVLDTASIPAEDPADVVLGTYAWDVATGGSSVLLHRMVLTNMSGELVLHDLATGDEVVVVPPQDAEWIASTAQVDQAGDRVLYQYRDADAADPRNLRLALWSDGASIPFAGDASSGIVAFALAPGGSVAYLAVPLASEGAPPEVFYGNLEDGVQAFGPLPSEAPLVLNPTVTSVSISADGRRIAVSAPGAADGMAPLNVHSFTVDVDTGSIFAYTADGGGLDVASVSPDGTSVVFYEPETGHLMRASFGDAASLQPLGDPLQVAPDRPMAWSPDGAHIAVGNVVGGAGYQAYALPIGGGDPIQLTDFEEGLWNSAIGWAE